MGTGSRDRTENQRGPDQSDPDEQYLYPWSNGYFGSKENIPVGEPERPSTVQYALFLKNNTSNPQETWAHHSNQTQTATFR